MKQLLKTFILTVLVLLVGTLLSQAQNRYDALRFGQLYPTLDPASMAVGGASSAHFSGFGSFIQNPASVALGKNSQIYFSLGTRDVSERASYLNTQTNFNDTQTGISSIGFMYKIPTTQGSLVVGSGYSQTTDFNRAFSVNAFNAVSSITDYMVDAPDQYFNPAFDAYAVDCTGTVIPTCFSVLRADGQYLGMDQYVEMQERGQLGEYALYLGTEFQKNLYVGIAVGFPVGSYSYQRTFIEEDLQNNYAASTYDVDAILVEDKIDASIRGFNTRIGMIYKPNKIVSFGASYTTRTRMEISETYSTAVQTIYKTLDADGFNTYQPDPYRGEISYNVYQPSRINVGATVHAGPIGFSAAAERINYSRVEMEGLGGIVERNENRAIRNEFKDIINFRAGMFTTLGSVTPSIGFSMNQSAVKGLDLEKQFLSGGVSVHLSDDITIDLGAQYGLWKDTVLLYDYFNQAGTLVPVTTSQDVSRIQGMVGIGVRF